MRATIPPLEADLDWEKFLVLVPDTVATAAEVDSEASAVSSGVSVGVFD